MNNKKFIITTGLVITFTLTVLFVFNKLLTREDTSGIFAEAQKGKFEITVSTTGELLAENSVDILGPEIAGNRRIRSSNLKITDLVPEGTEVKKGDYVATLDRTEFENQVRDYRERLTEMYADLEMLLIDTSLTMNDMRHQIRNQKHTLKEAEITFQNSKYETPTYQRQAEIAVDKAQRNLEQLIRSYSLSEAQTRLRVEQQRTRIMKFERRVEDYEEILKEFTVTAPSPGMIVYKKDRIGNKRKTGSNISPHDRVIATLPDLTSMLSKVYISEIDVNKVQPGQDVSVTIDALPDKSFKGSVVSVSNIGEILANTDSKVFEVIIRLEDSDLNLRPAMTTNNKIMIDEMENVIFIPKECVHTGADGIPVVYTKGGTRQIVLLGAMNDKDVVVKKGIDPGTILYMETPGNADNFKLSGEEILDVILEEEFNKRAMNTLRADTVKNLSSVYHNNTTPTPSNPAGIDFPI